MSFSKDSDKWPEQIRRFVYEGQPNKVAALLFERCLQPAIHVSIGEPKSTDAAIALGLGGEITRYTYWKGTLQAYGDPPLNFNNARNFVMGYSVFSEEIPPREHIVVALLGSVCCAYEKGFTRELGEII